MENVDKVTAKQVKKEQDKVKAQTENKAQEIQDLTKEMKEIQEEVSDLKAKLEQKESTLLKADYFLRYTLLHATSGDPNVMVRRIMRTSDSDSGQSLDWRFGDKCQFTLRGQRNCVTPQADHVTSGVDAEKSKDVIQQYYHWLELISNFSKYEAVSSEKISDTVKITLALQNVIRMSKETLLSPSMSASAIPQHGLKFMHFWSTTSTMQFL